MSDRPIIQPEQIAEWRKLRDEGMVSAVGEYTPDEFWQVLDALEAAEKRIAELDAFLHGLFADPPV